MPKAVSLKRKVKLNEPIEKPTEQELLCKQQDEASMKLKLKEIRPKRELIKSPVKLRKSEARFNSLETWQDKLTSLPKMFKTLGIANNN